MIKSKLVKAIKEPHHIPAALVRRLAPSHPRFGNRWFRLPDGSISFREAGFVSATSPAALLARHNYETSYIRSTLADYVAERSLEVGCGFGRLSPTFAGFSGEHVGIDINNDALSLARATYPAYDFRNASATGLPFPDKHFGLVTTWTVLQHISPDRIALACAELYRVLEPKGILLICEETRLAGESGGPNAHTWHRTIAAYANLLAPLQLLYSTDIDEISKLEGMVSPGTVMLWGHHTGAIVKSRAPKNHRSFGDAVSDGRLGSVL